MRGDYSNGRIYFIEPICDHEDNEFYYGSTIQKLCKRMDVHRSNYKAWKNGKSTKLMCYELFEKYGLETCKIYLVELYPCKSREELEAREGYYIRNYNCVNKCIPGRTFKEWYNDNRDKQQEYHKNYKIANKEKIGKIRKEYLNNNKERIDKIRKEYLNNNKDKIAEKNKEYRNINKDKINEKHKCECGGKYIHQNKSSHFKTKKHIQYTEQQDKDV